MGYVTTLRVKRDFETADFVRWLRSKFMDETWMKLHYLSQEDLRDICGFATDVCNAFKAGVTITDDCGNEMATLNMLEEWLETNDYADWILFEETHGGTHMLLRLEPRGPIASILSLLSPDEYRRHDEWIAAHDADGAYTGAIGGRYTYNVSQSSIGTFLSVNDAITGDRLDLNDPDN